jgi:hypothetical protein
MHERQMDGGAAVVAQGQTAEVGEPGQGALNGSIITYRSHELGSRLWVRM